MWRWDRIFVCGILTALALYVAYEFIYIIVSTIVNIVVRGG